MSVGAVEPPRQLTMRGATVLGVGSMIGAGIFSLLGEAGAIAGAALFRHPRLRSATSTCRPTRPFRLQRKEARRWQRPSVRP